MHKLTETRGLLMAFWPPDNFAFLLAWDERCAIVVYKVIGTCTYTRTEVV